MNSQDNSKIRIKALLKELDRQQLEVKKKNILIRIIVASVLLVCLIAFGFIYKKIYTEAEPTLFEEASTNVVEDSVLFKKELRRFQLVFDSLNQYPLARFLDKEEALAFQEELKSLHLPKTNIKVDTLNEKERVLAISSNYRYYIQIGIFKKQLLPDLPENMVYLQQVKDKDLYKYRIGPFATSDRAMNLVEILDLKDYLILEVSK